MKRVQEKNEGTCIVFYWDGMHSQVRTVFGGVCFFFFFPLFFFILSLACSGLQDVVIGSGLIKI